MRLRLKANVKELEKLTAKLKELAKSDYISKRTAREIGDIAIDGMKDLISKGISPIQGQGRFPAYKAVARVNLARKRGKKGVKKTGYPYSVQNKFPGKGVRPVNLELSGEFLDNLKSKLIPNMTSGYTTEVGFYDGKSQDKEKGHREEANTQPRRPIIPLRGEQLTRAILTEVLDHYRAAIQSFLDKLKK